MEGEEAVPYVAGEKDQVDEEEEPQRIDEGEQHLDGSRKRKIGINTASLRRKWGARALMFIQERICI